MNQLAREYIVGLVLSGIATVLFNPALVRALEPYQGFTKKEPMSDEEVASQVRIARCGIYTLCCFFPTWPRLIYPYNWLCTMILAPMAFYLFWRIHLQFESRQAGKTRDSEDKEEVNDVTIGWADIDWSRIVPDVLTALPASSEVILSTWDSDSDTRSISRGLAMAGFEHRIESGLCILSINVFRAMLEREYFSGYDAVWFISEGKVPSEPPPDSLQHVIESLTLSGLKRLKTVAEWMSKLEVHLALIGSDGTIIVSALDASDNASLLNDFHRVDVGGI